VIRVEDGDSGGKRTLYLMHVHDGRDLHPEYAEKTLAFVFQVWQREVALETIIGGKRRLHFGYEISLENLTSSEAGLILHEQIPASKHEDIKVRLESAEPKPAEQSELNLLDWELKLAPKEKRVVRFDFGIEAPQGMNITGLP